MRRGFRRMGVAVAVLISGVIAPWPATAGLLEPSSFDSIGTLSLTTPGSYTIDTTGATPTLVVGGTTYKGIVVNGTAVFDFSSITIASGVTLTAVKGGMPISLLSQSDAIINGRVDVSGFGGAAGAGASNTGVGGNGGVIIGSLFLTISGAGGGGFGGVGGSGGSYGSLLGGSGGAATRLPLFASGTLLGGSDGGGVAGFSGGGGGGAIEIGAYRNLTIGGEIDAIGADGLAGGGGSGGGILLHGLNVSITGLIDAQGGAGVPGNIGQHSYPGSGGGGGGQIDILYSTQNSFTSSMINLSGGVGGYNGGQAGLDGLSYIESGYTPTVPEPSSLILLGTSTLGLLGAAAFRRSRDRR